MAHLALTLQRCPLLLSTLSPCLKTASGMRVTILPHRKAPHAQPRGLSTPVHSRNGIQRCRCSNATARASSARAYLAFCWEEKRWAGCGGGSRGTAAGSCCAEAGPSCRRPWPASGGKPPPSAGWRTSCRHGPPSPGWSRARAPWRETPLAADTRPCACKGDTLEQGCCWGGGLERTRKSGGV